jgi:hypothetical protein
MIFDVSHNRDSSGSSKEAQGQDTLSLSSSEHELDDLHIPDATPRQELFQETTGQGPTSHAAIATLSPAEHDELSHQSEMLNSALLAGEQDSGIGGKHSTENRATSTDTQMLDLLDEPNESLSTDSQTHDLPNHPVKTDAKTTDSFEPGNYSAPSQTPIKLDLSNASMIRDLVDTLQSHGLLEKLGYKKEGHERTEPAKAEADIGANQNNHHRCSTCDKVFPRRCELK